MLEIGLQSVPITQNRTLQLPVVPTGVGLAMRLDLMCLTEPELIYMVSCGLTCWHVMILLHAGPPTITIQPASQLTTIGSTITLSCEGTGRGILTNNWEEREQGNRWKVIDGSNNTTLTIRNIQNSTRFRCTISNEAGDTRSHPASITILGKR